MEHGIKNGTTNIHVSRIKLNKNTPHWSKILWGVLLFRGNLELFIPPNLPFKGGFHTLKGVRQGVITAATP